MRFIGRLCRPAIEPAYRHCWCQPVSGRVKTLILAFSHGLGRKHVLTFSEPASEAKVIVSGGCWLKEAGQGCHAFRIAAIFGLYPLQVLT